MDVARAKLSAAREAISELRHRLDHDAVYERRHDRALSEIDDLLDGTEEALGRGTRNPDVKTLTMVLFHDASGKLTNANALLAFEGEHLFTDIEDRAREAWVRNETAAWHAQKALWDMLQNDSVFHSLATSKLASAPPTMFPPDWTVSTKRITILALPQAEF
jgi:hypothetical protein